MTKVFDWYIKWPILWDALLISLVLTAFKFNSGSFSYPDDVRSLDEIFSNILSTQVAFAGFILASLTIIVTVKANVAVKKVQDASNAIEMLFAPENYKMIVYVFRDAIIELILCMLIIYLGWMPIFNLPIVYLSMFIIMGVIVIIFSVVRTLAVLFRIVTTETG